ncbi:portal protein [Microbacterium phage Morrigan]|nr:portal protein [Microbacterium phage Morrigan]
MALAITTGTENGQMSKLEAHLLSQATPTYTAYYNGKMSYTLHGKAWEQYISEAFPDLRGQTTSENIFKTVIDLYAENLVPLPEELRGFSNCLVPLLSRGECVVLVDQAGEAHFPEHFEMMSDGRYTVAAMFTRSLEKQMDNVVFAFGDGRTRLFQKPIPEGFGALDLKADGWSFVEETTGNRLFRFALDDKGIGASLAALQDRVNHSIIDLTVVAEMYARPFWYLMNVQLPPKNPFMPAANQPETQAMQEQKGVDGATGRIFTTSGEGPFGQLTPPTIQDMIAYHDSIIDKIPQSFGIPGHYFKPGTGTPPTGVALKVLSKRFNNRIARIREDIEPVLIELAEELGIEKTKEVDQPKRRTDEEGNPIGEEAPVEYEYELWNTSDDLLQESLDAHGISLSTMGYPLEYIASVVTPGVDLDDYTDDTLDEEGVDPSVPGQPTDMTAVGQKGTPATPGQVKAYEQNPGQRAKA